MTRGELAVGSFRSYLLSSDTWKEPSMAVGNLFRQHRAPVQPGAEGCQHDGLAKRSAHAAPPFGGGDEQRGRRRVAVARDVAEETLLGRAHGLRHARDEVQ